VGGCGDNGGSTSIGLESVTRVWVGSLRGSEEVGMVGEVSVGMVEGFDSIDWGCVVGSDGVEVTVELAETDL